MPGRPGAPPDPTSGPLLEVCDRFWPRTERSFLVRVVAAALRHVRRPRLRVSLLLTDDAEMARLHGEYLDDRSPTDVLSFELDDGVEIAVSVECARREAKRRGHTIRAELALYIVHGILHACGYDDIDAAHRARMRDAEQRVLRALGCRVAPVDE